MWPIGVGRISAKTANIAGFLGHQAHHRHATRENRESRNPECLAKIDNRPEPDL
jgi:hypothetical protein